ncbi:helix-turn-helix transcriptional regulator [Actinophytocola oryzae]|uniref:ATP/maltotriose-dependent transcriptional regulator MalT n=1 Tax=Actinophytocola oryzae TaxID=502181 RepID=A0A4R7W4F5_9PSEU|nr:LuxR family transcriptional regulator [Actinophytocola oryzae]TDV57600.1 ATP/maltotriose-dependent transcriptional regulator MalT [Actinophytocola oryzae]
MFLRLTRITGTLSSRSADRDFRSDSWTGLPRLAERAEELDELLRALRAVGRGRPTGLVEVTGDAGIGKTTLLNEFAERAAALTGTTVLIGTATRDTDNPFGVFADALDQDLRPNPPKEVTRRGARAVLEHIGARGLVLIVDDCHLASPEALAPLRALLRKPPDVPVLFVLGFRDRQATSELRAALAGRSRRVAATEIRLAPLTEQDTEELLANRGIPAWRRMMHQESGGNPAYLDALLTEDDPDAHRHPLDATVRAELSGVSAAAEAVSRAASVLGDEFDLDLLTEIMDEPEATVLVAVDELIGLDLVRPREVGRLFAFRHPVVRRALYEGCEFSTRVELHCRADAALRVRGAAATQRAPHVRHSIRHGDLPEVAVLVDASNAVLAARPDTAVTWLTTAFQALPDTHPSRAELLLSLARALGNSGRLAECWDTMHAALRALSPDRADLRAEGVALIAAVERMLGVHGTADAMLRAELDARGPGDRPRVSAALRLEIAHNELVKGRARECRRLTVEALDSLSTSDDRALVASCLGLISKADGTVGDSVAAEDRLAEATAVLDSMLDDELTENLDAVLWVGWSEILLDHWYDAARHYDKAVDLAVRASNGLVLPNLLVGQVMALRSRGRLVEARAAARYGVYLAERAGSKEQLFGAAAMRLWADAQVGHVDRTTATRVDALIRGDAVVGWQGMLALRMVAEARLLSDDPEGTLETLNYVGGPELPKLSNSVSRVSWYEIMTRAELAVGRPEAAASWARSAVETAARLGRPGRTALAELATANVLLATDPAAALPHARAAVTGLATTGATMDEARARTALGVAMWHAGQHDQALRELRYVQVGYERVGAVDLAKATSRERRRVIALGCRTREDQPVEEAATLTKREREIAELVRDGLTNRQISRTLFIAEKTVEMHLTKLFGKLGVGNRAGVAAHLERSRTG